MTGIDVVTSSLRQTCFFDSARVTGCLCLVQQRHVFFNSLRERGSLPRPHAGGFLIWPMGMIRCRCCAEMLTVPGIVRVYCTDYFRAVLWERVMINYCAASSVWGIRTPDIR